MARARSLPEVAANPHWLGYRCLCCGREVEREYQFWVCPDCGLNGILDAVYDLEAIRRELAVSPFAAHVARGFWRFAPLLPVQPEAAHAAWTIHGAELLRAPGIAEGMDLAEVLLKDDTRLPSGSLKDRAAAIAITDAHRRGLHHIACSSTGNAAASLAVLGARAGFQSTIFVPATAPEAKLAQLLLHGASVERVDGTYDQTFDLSLRRIAENGWYSRNCAHNPLLVEGKKTAALELALELIHDGQALPDEVFVPVGDGCIVSSTAKAFAQLVELGLIDRSPRIWGVQAAGAAPLANAWRRAGSVAPGLEPLAILDAVEPLIPATVADSISVGIPRNRLRAWRSVGASGGGFLSVTDEEILGAIRTLARESGLFAEPSGAAGFAGLKKARSEGRIAAGARVAVLVTGNGLKDPLAALAGVRIPDPVPPAGDR